MGEGEVIKAGEVIGVGEAMIAEDTETEEGAAMVVEDGMVGEVIGAAMGAAMGAEHT